MGKTMPTQWTNWSGSLRFTPAKVVRPRSEEEVAQLVAQANEQRRTIRMVGACHSSSGIIAADDILLSLERMTGLETTDQVSCEAVVRPGTTLEDASEQLRKTPGWRCRTWATSRCRQWPARSAPARTARASTCPTWPRH